MNISKSLNLHIFYIFKEQTDLLTPNGIRYFITVSTVRCEQIRLLKFRFR
ncbi:MAG: hypothetical protein IKI11_10680 [Neisseriaceae bacterium]|nr:hypothetical protein [Neisseriaceae bacterium]